MKRILLSALGLLALGTAALAQVNVVPQIGVATSTLRAKTYTASAVGLVPAASATDIFCIAPSATKSVSVRQVLITGTAGTTITTPFLIYRRATVDTGGTAATGLALPVGVGYSSTNAASTATLVAYTANPTVTDSSPALVFSASQSLDVTTSDSGQVPFYFGSGGGDFYNQGLDLVKNSTQQLCINLNGVSVSSGVLDISMVWTEQ